MEWNLESVQVPAQTNSRQYENKETEIQFTASLLKIGSNFVLGIMCRPKYAWETPSSSQNPFSLTPAFNMFYKRLVCVKFLSKWWGDSGCCDIVSAIKRLEEAGEQCPVTQQCGMQSALTLRWTLLSLSVFRSAFWTGSCLDAQAEVRGRAVHAMSDTSGSWTLYVTVLPWKRATHHCSLPAPSLMASVTDQLSPLPETRRWGIGHIQIWFIFHSTVNSENVK